MDILEIEDVLKGLPDQALMQEAQQPTGQVPQYMVVSEIQRRSKMRKSFEAQKEQPSTTIAEQILTGGVASVAPPPPQMMGAMGMPQQPPAPPQQPPMGQQQPPMPPQQMPPQQPPMPQQGAPMPAPVQMAGGGVVKMASGEMTPYSDPQGLIVQALEQGVPGSVLTQQAPQFADLINRLEAQMMTKMGVDQYQDIEKAYIPLGQEFDSATAPPGMMEEVVVTGQRPPPLEPQGQLRTRALPQSEAVGPAAPAIDTRAENLIFDQPVVAEGFEKPNPISDYLARVRGNLSDMPTEISPMGTYSEVTGRIMPRVGDVTASDIYTTGIGDPGGFSGTASGVSRRQRRETQPKGITFQELVGTENIFTPSAPSGGQMSRVRSDALDESDSPYRLMSNDDINAAIARSQADPYNAGFDYSNIPGPQMAGVVIDPKQSAATQVDSAKLNLDTATKSDGPLLNMALAEKSLTDFSIDPDLQRQADEIIGDRSELVPRGTPDIQMQGIKYVSPETPELVAPSFAGLISEQERRLAKIREDVKRDVGAQALINLGAGVMEGDVAGGLRAAGQAASKIRTAERAAESDIANLQTRIKMAEEQGRFDTAKALRADALKEAQFEATLGLKAGELEQTLKIARERIASEGNTEAGRKVRAEYNALLELIARMQAQGVYKNDEAINAQIRRVQQMLGVEVEPMPSETDTSGYVVLSTE